MRIPARIVHVLYEGNLGKNELSRLTRVFDHCGSFFARDADAVEFHSVAEGSALLNAFLSRAPQAMVGSKRPWMTHWSLKVPADPGGLVKEMRPKHRNWLRRKQHDLDEAYPGRGELALGEELHLNP